MTPERRNRRMPNDNDRRADDRGSPRVISIARDYTTLPGGTIPEARAVLRGGNPGAFRVARAVLRRATPRPFASSGSAAGALVTQSPRDAFRSSSPADGPHRSGPGWWCGGGGAPVWRTRRPPPKPITAVPAGPAAGTATSTPRRPVKGAGPRSPPSVGASRGRRPCPSRLWSGKRRRRRDESCRRPNPTPTASTSGGARRRSAPLYSRAGIQMIFSTFRKATKGTDGMPRMPAAVFTDIFLFVSLRSSVMTRASLPSLRRFRATASTYGSASS